jgi:hypothetical protein
VKAVNYENLRQGFYERFIADADSKEAKQTTKR